MAVIEQTNQQVEESNKQRREPEEQKALENRLSQLQQQEERLVEQIRQPEIGTDGQHAASQADIRRFEDEARQETLGQPRVPLDVWERGESNISTHKDSENTRGRRSQQLDAAWTQTW